MTMRELLIVCPLHICAIEATIRDNGKFVDEIHISPMAVKDKHRMYNHQKGKEVPRWSCIQKPINYKDIGKDYWGIFFKNIPNKLLDMAVTYSDVWDGWRTNNGLHEHKKLILTLSGKDTCVLEPPKPKQIDGQMCLDFGEVET